MGSSLICSPLSLIFKGDILPPTELRFGDTELVVLFVVKYSFDRYELLDVRIDYTLCGSYSSRSVIYSKYIS